MIEPEPMRQTTGTAGNKSLLSYRYDVGIPGACFSSSVDATRDAAAS